MRVVGLLERKSKTNIARELYIFSFINLLGGSAYGMYYGIFLYRQSFDIRVLVIDSLLVSIATWAGYLLGTAWIHKHGYKLALRASFLLMLAVSIVTLLLMNHIRELYPLLSLARGLPGGLYAAVTDIFLLQELSAAKRSKYLNLNLSIQFIVTVMLPFLLGGIIKFASGYTDVFLLAAAIYLVALCLPVSERRNTSKTFNIRGELKVLRKPGIREFSINNALASGADQLNALLLGIVPFLLFKSELKVGSFTSFIAIAAAVISLIANRTNFGQQIKLGFVGNSGRFVSNLILCLSWTPWALMVQGMINKAMSPLNDPIAQKLQLDNASAILGRELHDKALALNLVSATVSLIGKSSALAAFLLILSINQAGEITILRYLLVTYALWKIVNYIWIVGMQRRLQAQTVDMPVAELAHYHISR